MIRFCADENFNNKIIRGLLRRKPELDIVRVQDVPGLIGTSDTQVLDWAAIHNRILVSHDVRTLVTLAFERVDANLKMPGVIEVSRQLPIGQVIDDLILLADCSQENEWEGQVL